MSLTLNVSYVRSLRRLVFGALRCSEASRTATGTNPTVVVGTGKLSIRSRRVGILSWVPISGRLEMSVPSTGRGQLSKLGLILRHNRSAANAQRWLEQRVNIPTHVVDIEHLVDAGAHKTGLSSRLPTLLHTAA